MGELKKGELLDGTEVFLDVEGNRSANWHITIPDGFPIGKYNVFAEMKDEKGKLIVSQSVEISVEGKAENSA